MLGLFVSLLAVSSGSAHEGMLPSAPVSEFLSLGEDEPTVDFCSEWNPEFAYRGHKCCGGDLSRNLAMRKRAARAQRARCAPSRTKWGFCDEMSEDQRQYVDDVSSGRIPDVLKHLEQIFDTRGKQSFCASANGFLVSGRPLLMTKENRIEIRHPNRCTNFGTDRLVAAMEWVGREVNKEYHEEEYEKARIVIADLSAPRGSCISGSRGRRAHKSHTTGVDIDITFFNPVKRQAPEERFTRKFYVGSNWWFLKKVFRNPYACVKVVLLDKQHKRLLELFAKDDPEWKELSPYIRHVKGHKDHFHIRVGETAGAPGCKSEASDEDQDIADEAPESETSAEVLTGEAVAGQGAEGGDTDSEGAAEDSAESAEASESSPAVVAAGATSNLIQKITRAVVKTADAAPEELRLAHKQEPEITQKYQAQLKPKKRSKKRRKVASSRKKRRKR